MLAVYTSYMDTFSKHSSVRGSREWASFSPIRSDHSNAYPVAEMAEIRVTKAPRHVLVLARQPRFAH